MNDANQERAVGVGVPALPLDGQASAPLETPIHNQAEAARGNVANFRRPQGIVTGAGRDRITGHRQVAGIAHPHAAVGR